MPLPWCLERADRAVKQRQFHRLAGLSRTERERLILEGLAAVGANVVAIATELEVCNEARAFRAARLLHNVGREEAGKFLVLIDGWRSADSDQAVMSRQFRRAGDHLCKLIYSQIADYSIGSQSELLSAVETHRQSLHLDGPNDVDWIYRNELLMEREGALYVDLVENEEDLSWWTPNDIELPYAVPRPMRLVQEILSTGLVSHDGATALRSAWAGFDAHSDSQSSEWTERTAEALRRLPERNVVDGRWRAGAWFVADRWPMPMVEIEIEQVSVGVEALAAERERRLDEELRREYGVGDDEDG